MPEFQVWTFPEVPPSIVEILFENDKKIVIVGVIGKSAFPDCNKLVAFDILDNHPSLIEHEPQEGQIQFYFKPSDSVLFVHFETSYDAACMQKMLENEVAAGTFGQFPTFNQCVRTRFARMLLLAIHSCHIIVFVELSVYFDASLLPVFKALKLIRDKHILKFLPKMVKSSSTGALLGKMGRLCSPRFLFLFENFPDGYEKTKESISMLEFEVQDNIYRMLRSDFIVTNSVNSLFSIPSNKRFVYYNTNSNLRDDPILSTKDVLDKLLSSNSKDEMEIDLEEFSPYRGFGKPLAQCKPETAPIDPNEDYLKQRSFMELLREHIDDAIAMDTALCDNANKYRAKTNFTLWGAKTWYEIFRSIHKLFIENPDNVDYDTTDAEYRAYLDNFDKIMNVEDEFFSACCDIALNKAFAMYNNPTLTHYSSVVHKKLTEEAVVLYRKYARGSNIALNEEKLRSMCDECWKHGKRQCEVPSLRGNPCILPKHIVQDASEHSSGRVFISTCNCGRTQGRREDPYTMRHANYEFYEYMAKNCNLCMKVTKMHFAVFEPSTNDYRAAEYEIHLSKLTLSTSNDNEEDLVSEQNESDIDLSQPLTASQGGHSNLSLDSINKTEEEERDDDNSSDESLQELVLQVKDKEIEREFKNERSLIEQHSTTEYLAGMVHTESPAGLLPQFPSWSLVCVGSSFVYSHNTGLMEHFQSGFLSGSNFLLPWDVQVRLEHSASWVAVYEKTRYRKMGDNFILKIFVGYEYECPRGHRFMMSAPDKILRGGSGILRDSGSKVVYNNMPLYFPCPCQSKNSDVAQLMRIHVVTPKAPVNVIIDPKVRTGDYVFTLGFINPPKLTQSAYWILRLPYVYQGDEGPIMPPTTIDAATASNYGCMLPGIFGVSEMELDE